MPASISALGLLASTSRVVGRFAALGVITLIAGLVAVSWFAAAPLARRLGRPRQQLFACLAVTAPIVVVTLMRDGWPRFTTADLGPVFRWWRQGWGKVANDLTTDSEAFLNVVLFVPAGTAWAAMTRRPGQTVLALAGGSFVIETLQAVLGLGAPDTTDLVANSLGALAGVGLAAVGVAAWRRMGPSSLDPASPRLSRRVRVASGAGVVIVVVVAVLTVQWRADVARDRLLAELHRTYDGTTLHDMDAVFHAGDDLSRYDQFVARNSVRPDSIVYGESPPSAQVRYPLEYFGVHRCVFVTWSSADVEFSTAEGDICTRYLADHQG